MDVSPDLKMSGTRTILKGFRFPVSRYKTREWGTVNETFEIAHEASFLVCRLRNSFTIKLRFSFNLGVPKYYQFFYFYKGISIERQRLWSAQACLRLLHIHWNRNKGASKLAHSKGSPFCDIGCFEFCNKS